MTRLSQLFDGWDGYQTSLCSALESATPDQLRWRPADGRRAVGETFRHIALGRITWFARMNGPGLDKAKAAVPKWFTDGDGSRHADESAVPTDDPARLSKWIRLSWEPIRAVLDQWTIADLSATYRHRFRGVDYAVSRQWTVWRILSHDMHHGGQIAMMLACQGVTNLQLGLLGGHLAEPPKAAS